MHLLNYFRSDDIDGLSHLTKALAQTGFMAITAGAFVFDEHEEDTKIKRKQLEKNRLHLQVEDFDELYNIPHKMAGQYVLTLEPPKVGGVTLAYISNLI